VDVPEKRPIYCTRRGYLDAAPAQRGTHCGVRHTAALGPAAPRTARHVRGPCSSPTRVLTSGGKRCSSERARRSHGMRAMGPSNLALTAGSSLIAGRIHTPHSLDRLRLQTHARSKSFPLSYNTRPPRRGPGARIPSRHLLTKECSPHWVSPRPSSFALAIPSECTCGLPSRAHLPDTRSPARSAERVVAHLPRATHWPSRSRARPTPPWPCVPPLSGDPTLSPSGRSWRTHC